ncbi:MAG: AAA family ATPase [Dethiobacteria bacterium]|nr:AAA family ATPase [Dethiobacteria bacterium]
MLYPGLPLKLTTNNPLYRGTLDSKVITVEDKKLVISTPLQNGRLTLLPVGEILQVRPAGSTEQIGFQAEILARTFQPERTLTVTSPHTISRSGRSSAASSTDKAPSARVIAVTSGKGGVGKTTMSINLSLTLARIGHRVCLIDVDLGTANVEFLLNLKAPYNIAHLLAGEREMSEILIEGPEGLLILPGSSGLEKLANLSEWQFTRLVNSFNILDQKCDIVVLDTGAGISANVTNFLMAADEILLITTPDPHAVLDAYALIKTISRLRDKLKIRLVVNRVEKPGDEARVKLNLLNTCQAHLNQPLEYLGPIPESKAVSRSIREMTPFILHYPESEAAAALLKIAYRLGGTAEPEADTAAEEQRGLRRFIGELQKLFSANG